MTEILSAIRTTSKAVNASDASRTLKQTATKNVLFRNTQGNAPC
jgi:hypothetical protein